LSLPILGVAVDVEVVSVEVGAVASVGLVEVDSVAVESVPSGAGSLRGIPSAPAASRPAHNKPVKTRTILAFGKAFRPFNSPASLSPHRMRRIR
jgi:hypothetical protein